MMFFGERIRFLREKENLPLRKVAAYLDIDTSILSKIERGERRASIDLVAKISMFFGVKEEELLIEYLGDEIAKQIYHFDNFDAIFEVAEKKAKYLQCQSAKQGKIRFK